MNKKILIIDSNPNDQWKWLEQHSTWQFSKASSIALACEYFDLSKLLLILVEEKDFLNHYEQLNQQSFSTPIVVISEESCIRSAVKCVKYGAIDYIAKPSCHEELIKKITIWLDIDTLPYDNLNKKPAKQSKKINSHANQLIKNMVGENPNMKKLFNHIKKVAPTDASVLIRGESGTGKELVAQSIHQFSQRKTAPIISINCAAIAESLIESELFGHEKGAFTGALNTKVGLIEAANGGTFFMDEIGELPLDAQARLLRVLQEGEIRKVGAIQSKKIDIRLIAATHRDLYSEIKKGTFREDLYYRLKVIELTIPPLRDREKDIILLANFFIEKNCKKMGLTTFSQSSDFIKKIMNYSWPGNVRELEHAIERAIIFCDTQELTAKDLDIDDTSTFSMVSSNTEQNNDKTTTSTSVENYLKEYILTHENKMNEIEIAKNLGISRKSLWEKRKRLNIPRKNDKKISISD